MSKKKHKVRFKRRNWDADYAYDIINGLGFTITEPAIFQDDHSDKKSLYGARSPLYGTDFQDEQAFIERHRCTCGAIKGAAFVGQECPICHTIVDYKDTDIKVTGWISLGENYIIQPLYYNILGEAIGKKVLLDIVMRKNVVDKNGNIRKATSDDTDEKPESPFSKIGTEEFRERFEEIMLYFKNKKKNKADVISNLIKEKNSVFASKIPIYSTLLRPQSMSTDSYYFTTVDKNIKPLFSLSEKLKDAHEVDKPLILWRIQVRVNTIWDYNFELLNGKNGFIRDQILGGSLNYTSRNVIIPDPTLRANEVDLSYHTFLELFKSRIMYYLMKLGDMNLNQAYTLWNEAFTFNPKVYEIMKYIIEKEGTSIIINRNPTINYYSILLMKIRHVKPADTDYTLSVPLSILPGLNADFDGDILNIIGLMNDSMKRLFRKFDPVKRMFISRDSGKMNDLFTINKGLLVDAYRFCTI